MPTAFLHLRSVIKGRHGHCLFLHIPVPPAQMLPHAHGRLTVQRMLNHWYAQTDDGVTGLSTAPVLCYSH